MIVAPARVNVNAMLLDIREVEVHVVGLMPVIIEHTTVVPNIPLQGRNVGLGKSLGRLRNVGNTTHGKKAQKERDRKDLYASTE